MEEGDITVSRRRKCDVHSWKRTKEVRERYSAKRLPGKPQCAHKKTVFKCNELNMQDIRRFHENFYKTCCKKDQDNFILRYTTQDKPKRNRTKTGASKGIVTKYFVKVKPNEKCNKQLVQVCQKAFLNILGIKKDRVQGQCKRHFVTGESPKETRGGDRKSKIFQPKREAVRQFIGRYEPVESHYCRNKTTRLYLPSHLSIRKLWRQYNKNSVEQMKVKYDYFRTVFVDDFNISFKSAGTDKCSRCICLQNKIKLSSTSASEKNKCIIELRCHKLRAKAFTKKIQKVEENTVSFSFDCEKNLTLPKLPDQASYYLRQLYAYNLTVCCGSSKDPQNSNTVSVYAWLENEKPKGSNEISSALYYHLSNFSFENNIGLVNLFCDGCPGQNKNSAFLCMLGYWLCMQAPTQIKEICVTYPVVGHSYLPPDRVFGRIEKVVRSKEVIVTPEEYFEIFSDEGKVIRLGSVECLVRNWKETAKLTLKATSAWHFKISQCKRLYIKRSKSKSVLYRGEAFYNSNLSVYRSLLKKGCCFSRLNPQVLPVGASVIVKTEKLKDVDKLLSKHFGEQWKHNENLVYYKDVIDNRHPVENATCKEDEDDNIYDTDDEDLRI